MLQKECVLAELLNLLVDLQDSALFKDYFRVGGTALALQLGHRESDDIDLFTLKKLNGEDIAYYLQNHYGNNYEIFHQEESILQTTISGIKVDFVSTPVILIEDPIKEDGITFLGLKDIAAMKLRAIGNKRNRAKDFIDICYLLKHHTLTEMFEYYKIKYSCNDITNIKKTLAESAGVNPYEWEKVRMIKNDIFLSDIPRILKDEILEYNRANNINPKKLFSFKRTPRPGDKGE
jgi:hypothetical protein